MVMIEMRDAVYDTAFDLLDEAKLNAKKTKLTLCELENAMYDCYEASRGEHGEKEEGKEDIDFRGVSGYPHDEEYDEEEPVRRMAHRRRSRLRRRLV